jgi:hypothetical protein
MPIWYICVDLVHFSCLGVMYQEKSGNPGQQRLVTPSFFANFDHRGRINASHFYFIDFYAL